MSPAAPNADRLHPHPHPDLDAPGAGAGTRGSRPLVIAFLITLAALLAQIVGGLLSGSLALIADAAHVGTDAAALALALFAAWLARRPATPARSFGFLRAEVLAALVNAAALFAVAAFVFREAFERLGAPPAVDAGLMLPVAVAGLAANAAAAWVLFRGGVEENLNARGAFLNVVGDLLGSVAAIVAALLMLATDWYVLDPILSGAIGLLVLGAAWRLLRESVDVLLEATPRGLDAAAIRRAMEAAPGVAGVHDLHVWLVTSGLVALSGHVAVETGADWDATLDRLATTLRDEFGIVHVTLQPEPTAATTASDCSLDTAAGRAACRAAADRAAADRAASSAGAPARVRSRTASRTTGAPE